MMPFLAPMNQFPHAPPLNESESKYDFFTHLRIPRASLAHKTPINYFPISLENEASSVVLSPGGCEADPDTCPDMRQYYFTNTDMGDGTLKSELILLRTNLDDNGTFQCVAENRAGIAVANFTLNVVVPVPPKPPQAEMIIHLLSRSRALLGLVSAISNTNFGATYSSLGTGCCRGAVSEGVPDRYRGRRGDCQRPHHRHRHPRGCQVPRDEEVS